MAEQSNKQKRRQSSDFKEIWNIQSDMQTTNEKWSRLFHNWDDPDNCTVDRSIDGCFVCDQLRKYGQFGRILFDDEIILYVKPEHWTNDD